MSFGHWFSLTNLGILLLGDKPVFLVSQCNTCRRAVTLEFNPPCVSGVPNLFTLNTGCKVFRELAWRLHYHSAAQKLYRQKRQANLKSKKGRKKGVEGGCDDEKADGPLHSVAAINSTIVNSRHMAWQLSHPLIWFKTVLTNVRLTVTVKNLLFSQE